MSGGAFNPLNSRPSLNRTLPPQIVRNLHPQPMLRCAPKGLLEPNRQISRNRSLALADRGKVLLVNL